MKRITILIALLALIAVGCASGTSSPSASPTEEPTPEPTESAEPSSEEGGLPLPSFLEGAGDLADLLPTEIAGLTIEYVHATGDQVVSEDLPPEVQDFFDRTGATEDDLASAIGFAFDLESGVGFSILAFKVAGADEGELRTLFLETFETEGSVIGEEESVGGKTVTPISDDGTVSGYVYVRDDVVFMVGGEPMTAVEEALAALP